MISISLQSGSNGNCIFVEADGVKLLFDAGISAKQATARMKLRDRDIRECTALIISHDHSDHTRSAGIFQRRFNFPVYVTRPTYDRVAGLMGRVSQLRHFERGEVLSFGDVQVETVPTPHDGVDGVAFVVHHAGRQLGILTDLGHPFSELRSLLERLDAVYLESNYDPEMLETGPYPRALKARIAGPRGHLSNVESARLLADHGGDGLRWVVLAHLSEQNNAPELAVRTHRRVLGDSVPIHAASRYHVGPVLEI